MKQLYQSSPWSFDVRKLIAARIVVVQEAGDVERTPRSKAKQNQGHQRAWFMMTIICNVPNLSASFSRIRPAFVDVLKAFTHLISRKDAGVRGVEHRMSTPASRL